MTPEQMTNEELAQVVRDFREKMLNSGGRAWSLTIPAKETDPDIVLAEVETRLRNSIPKPVVKVEYIDRSFYQLTINGKRCGSFIYDKKHAEEIAQETRALLTQGGGDER